MTEWLNTSVLVSSVLGSLVAGGLLLTAKPLWWNWVTNEAVSKGIKAWFPFAVLLFLLIGSASYLNYVNRSHIPPFHPSLTEEEAAAARSECMMKALEATAAIDIYGRDRASSSILRRLLGKQGIRVE